MATDVRKVLLVVAILFFASIAAILVLFPDTENDDDPPVDIVGKWYLVNSISYDEDQRLYTTINRNMNMEIEGTRENDTLFYGSVQTDINFQNGTDFTGAKIEKNIIFQYETEFGHVKAIGSPAKAIW